ELCRRDKRCSLVVGACGTHLSFCRIASATVAEKTRIPSSSHCGFGNRMLRLSRQLRLSMVAAYYSSHDASTVGARAASNCRARLHARFPSSASVGGFDTLYTDC